jgi:hypothetical protein
MGGSTLGSSGLGQRKLASSCDQSNETSVSVNVSHFFEDPVNSQKGLYPMQLVNILV